MGKRRPQAERDAVLGLLVAGSSHLRASELTGVPVQTIRTWIQRGDPIARPTCARCGQRPHDLERLDADTYAWHVSVAKRASVARMDEFVGPKR